MFSRDLNSHEIHKINFYLNIKSIIYDIYLDVRLKSLRNVGIMFYDIKKNYEGLIYVTIRPQNSDVYTFPETKIMIFHI